MNLKKIIIYEFEILFNILEEIKEKFDLDLIKVDNQSFNNQIKTISSQYLIISKSELNGYKNHLVLNNFPIKIEKLIQLINLKFLKDTFNSQSDISIGFYKLNLNSRQISKNNKTLDLTEREINLIIYLKKKEGSIKIDELQKEVWGYNSKLETHTVETHIYRLRKKIKDQFEDEKFIISSKKGYSIN
tara:strand:+ start:951 stop:1514 length:564 start_codon:yes stop_codon:yes gene_type:complete